MIEVGGAGKDYSQINDADINNAALAVDNIDMANGPENSTLGFRLPILTASRQEKAASTSLESSPAARSKSIFPFQ